MSEQINTTSILIPEGTTDIEEYAFARKNLTSIEIPKTVTHIGDGAFAYNHLTTLVIPNSVTSIGNNAFTKNNLSNVEISDSITRISSDAFSHNQLTSIEIPDSVTSIDSDAFSNNQLMSVTLGKSVKTIGLGAFANNKLTSIKMPDSVKNIFNHAFSQNQLTNITIGKLVTIIDDFAFSNNNLTSVTIPNSVTSIGNHAFTRNEQLTNVIIGNSVTSIGEYAFGSDVTTVTMPAIFHNDHDKKRIFGDFNNIQFHLPPIIIPISDPIDDLFLAIINNNITEVNRLINMGIDLNSKRGGDTAIILASKLSKIKILKDLIKAGADIYLTDNNGKTALMCAFELFRYPIIDELFKNMIETPHEQSYRNIINSWNSNFYNFLNSSRPDFKHQLRAYINSDHDYLSNIKGFVDNVYRETDTFLIVDFDNVAYNTLEKSKSSSYSTLYTLPVDGAPRTRDKLLPNVKSNEMIDYTSAALAILRYAKEQRFSNIIFIAKNSVLQNQLQREYIELKINGKLNILQNKNGTTIDAEFIDTELQKYLIDTKVSFISIKSKIDYIGITDSEVTTSSISKEQFKEQLHKIKGTDDSLIILISNAIKQKCGKIPTVISSDNHIISDFKSNILYTCPFLTQIDVNGKHFSEFVVNYTKGVDASIYKEIINDTSVTDISKTLFVKVNAFHNDYFKSYFYNLSEQSRTSPGFDVKNWYSSPSGTSDRIVAKLNTTAPNNNGRIVEYIDPTTRESILNSNGKPYLSQNGEIALLEFNRVPYIMEQYTVDRVSGMLICDYITPGAIVRKPYRDELTKEILKIKINKYTSIPYCYEDPPGSNIWKAALNNGYIYTDYWQGNNTTMKIHIPGGWIMYAHNDGSPVLREIIEPYKDSTGKIDTIKILDWQPYAKKYISTNKSSGEHVKYYEKYMKYKAKYNELKKKLGF